MFLIIFHIEGFKLLVGAVFIFVLIFSIPFVLFFYERYSENLKNQRKKNHWINISMNK